MSAPILPPELEKMSIAERILLVEDLWDSVAADQKALDVTKAQRKTLDNRLQRHQANPEENRTWHDVKKRLHAP